MAPLSPNPPQPPPPPPPLRAAPPHPPPPPPNPRLPWFALHPPTGQVLSRQGLDPDLPIPVGSLTKPFLALAYARTHTTFPHLPCKGSADRCWLPQGHGTLDLQA